MADTEHKAQADTAQLTHQHTALRHRRTLPGSVWPHLVSPWLHLCCCWLSSLWLKVREVWKRDIQSVCGREGWWVRVHYVELNSVCVWSQPEGRALSKQNETHYMFPQRLQWSHMCLYDPSAICSLMLGYCLNNHEHGSSLVTAEKTQNNVSVCLTCLFDNILNV